MTPRKMKHSTLTSIKFLRLKRRLGLPSWQVAGILEMLWAFACTNAQDGAVGRFQDDDIAAWMEWSGESRGLIEALVDCEWVDPHPEYRLIIHDWEDHCPRWIKGAQARHAKDHAKQPANDHAKQAAKQGSPNLTQPNLTFFPPDPPHRGDQKNDPFDIDPSKPRLSAIWHRFLAHCATLKRKPTRESTELWIERLKAISEDLAVKTVESWIASRRYTPPAEWLEAACKTATGPPLRPVGAVKAPWQENGHWLCQDAVGKCWWDGKKWVPIKGKAATTIQEFLDSAKAPAAVSVFEEG